MDNILLWGSIYWPTEGHVSLDDVSHIGLLERAAQYRLCLILNVDGRTVRPTISDAFDSFDCWYTSDGMRQQISPPPPSWCFFFFWGGGAVSFLPARCLVSQNWWIIPGLPCMCTYYRSSIWLSLPQNDVIIIDAQLPFSAPVLAQQFRFEAERYHMNKRKEQQQWQLLYTLYTPFCICLMFIRTTAVNMLLSCKDVLLRLLPAEKKSTTFSEHRGAINKKSFLITERRDRPRRPRTTPAPYFSFNSHRLSLVAVGLVCVRVFLWWPYGHILLWAAAPAGQRRVLNCSVLFRDCYLPSVEPLRRRQQQQRNFFLL